MNGLLKYAAVFFVFIIILIVLFDQFIMPLYTRHGEEFVLMDVTLMQRNEAHLKLTDAGLEPVLKDSIYDESIEEGKIIQQYPQAFSRVKKGRQIYITYSLGPQIKLMPDLRGLTIREVRLKLQDLVLEEGRIVYKENKDFPEGVVFKQSPDAGSSFSPGSSVNFYVSLGTGDKDKRLPKLIGLNLVEAQRKLQNLKILNIRIESEIDESLLPGTVIHQEPLEGTPILEIKEVIITISK